MSTTNDFDAFVRQEDRSGCGIACVAMLCRKTYQEMKAAWVGLGGDISLLTSAGNGAGITTDDIDALLDFFEINRDAYTAPKIVRIQSPDYDWMHHFVVVDEKGNILDPSLIA